MFHLLMENLEAYQGTDMSADEKIFLCLRKRKAFERIFFIPGCTSVIGKFLWLQSL